MIMKHKDDNFRKERDYMNGQVITNCPLAFRIRCEMVKEIKGNCKDKYRRKGGEDALQCEDCSSQETHTQSHCLVCHRWKEIRHGLQLNSIDGMVTFFQRMPLEKLRSRTGSM